RSGANAVCKRFIHCDLRLSSDVDQLPQVDWVVDASANSSVLAGHGSFGSSRQAIENNLLTTINLLEYCKSHRSGLLLMSSSRVYSIPSIRQLKLEEREDHFSISVPEQLREVCCEEGVTESFPTSPPLSLYGATKLTSEILALEYASAYGFPVWINRCGILAGAGQFGRPDQGIVAYWIHSWFERLPLRYVGFRGLGLQVRDCLHPSDLGDLLLRQMAYSGTSTYRVFNASGGIDHHFSLAQLSQWCNKRFGDHIVGADLAERHADVPWLALDNTRTKETFAWQPQITLNEIFSEIADFAEQNPNWIRNVTRN
ncbi:MAG TPA: NAD-dependent epimerase/dehydratase family protein, partial [Pirellula sp.]|nr:NAD-dependent epimerase/dehydratase family protein [Pirellula sp.]